MREKGEDLEKGNLRLLLQKSGWSHAFHFFKSPVKSGLAFKPDTFRYILNGIMAAFGQGKFFLAAAIRKVFK